MSRALLIAIGVALVAPLLAQEGQGPTPLRVDLMGLYPDVPVGAEPPVLTGPLRVDLMGLYPDVPDPSAGTESAASGALRVDLMGQYPDVPDPSADAGSGGPAGGPQGGQTPSSPPDGSSTTSGAAPPQPQNPLGQARPSKSGSTQSVGKSPPPSKSGGPAQSVKQPPKPGKYMPTKSGGPSQPSRTLPPPAKTPPKPQPIGKSPTPSSPPGRVGQPPLPGKPGAPRVGTNIRTRATIASYDISGPCAKLGSILVINGSGFGRQGSAQLVLLGNGRALPTRLVVRRWADGVIQVQLPNDPALLNGRVTYSFGLQDRRRQLISNTDKTLTFCR